MLGYPSSMNILLAMQSFPLLPISREPAINSPPHCHHAQIRGQNLSYGVTRTELLLCLNPPSPLRATLQILISKSPTDISCSTAIMQRVQILCETYTLSKLAPEELLTWTQCHALLTTASQNKVLVYIPFWLTSLQLKSLGTIPFGVDILSANRSNCPIHCCLLFVTLI